MAIDRQKTVSEMALSVFHAARSKQSMADQQSQASDGNDSKSRGSSVSNQAMTTFTAGNMPKTTKNKDVPRLDTSLKNNIDTPEDDSRAAIKNKTMYAR